MPALEMPPPAPWPPLPPPAQSAGSPAEADAREGDGRVAGAADGPVMAKRQVAGGQESGSVFAQITDRAAGARAEENEAAAARVAAAPEGLVVLERTVRD